MEVGGDGNGDGGGGGGGGNAVQISFKANGQPHRSVAAWWHEDAPVLSKRA